jgi:hypothetical protein
MKRSLMREDSAISCVSREHYFTLSRNIAASHKSVRLLLFFYSPSISFADNLVSVFRTGSGSGTECWGTA